MSNKKQWMKTSKARSIRSAQKDQWSADTKTKSGGFTFNPPLISKGFSFSVPSPPVTSMSADSTLKSTPSFSSKGFSLSVPSPPVASMSADSTLKSTQSFSSKDIRYGSGSRSQAPTSADTTMKPFRFTSPASITSKVYTGESLALTRMSEETNIESFGSSPSFSYNDFWPYEETNIEPLGSSPSFSSKDFWPLSHTPTTQPDVLEFETQTRPYIDLIDSLRALGVEKDLTLPTIAVIGDRNSEKISVLEALSGVCLSRSDGLFTPCPLELKLKKSSEGSAWCGKISYKSQSIELTNPAEMESEFRKVQNSLAGTGNGESDQMITLEVMSPNVPNLTLIDLPGQDASPNQNLNFQKQVNQLIKKDTIFLVVIPCYVDIESAKSLQLAQKMDLCGMQTLVTLTKPDLVEKGKEDEILGVVRKFSCFKKGCIMVKCRGPSDIQSSVSLESAINNERAFFENHQHFSVLLHEGCATVPTLAEKLTAELVKCICRTLPTLKKQIKYKLKDARNKLELIGTEVPDTGTERLGFLIERITQFADGVRQTTQGEEEVSKGRRRLFTKMRQRFKIWETKLNSLVDQFSVKTWEEVDVYENQYRGREMVGFTCFRTFKNIARKLIHTFEDPAVSMLNQIMEFIESSLNNIASKCFLQYPNLYRCAKGKIDQICSAQQKEAEQGIRTQFILEKIIYCQDTYYGEALKGAREGINKQIIWEEEAGLFARSYSQYPVTWNRRCSTAKTQSKQLDEMSLHLRAYFKNATVRLANQIPLIIQHHVLFELVEKLQAEMMQLIQDKEKLDVLLQEDQEISKERRNLKDCVERMSGALQKLAGFPKKKL